MAAKAKRRLAELHPPVSDALLRIAGNVRSTAALLAVVVATRLHRADENAFPGSETPPL
jgi:hypothetical protein